MCSTPSTATSSRCWSTRWTRGLRAWAPSCRWTATQPTPPTRGCECARCLGWMHPHTHAQEQLLTPAWLVPPAGGTTTALPTSSRMAPRALQVGPWMPNSPCMTASPAGGTCVRAKTCLITDARERASRPERRCSQHVARRHAMLPAARLCEGLLQRLLLLVRMRAWLACAARGGGGVCTRLPARSMHVRVGTRVPPPIR